jgi:hypothetical protein
MRTLLINPETKTVTEHNYDGSWRSIAPTIGAGTFDIIFTEVGDIHVDDEGLLKSPQFFWKLDTMHTPIAGKGLVFGFADDEGDNTASEISIERLLEKLDFYTLDDVADTWGMMSEKTEEVLSPQELKMIRNLRNRGYATIIWMPQELDGIDPSLMESSSIKHGFQVIEMNKAQTNEPDKQAMAKLLWEKIEPSQIWTSLEDIRKSISTGEV